MTAFPKHPGPDIPDEYTDESYAAEQMATAQALERYDDDQELL